MTLADGTRIELRRGWRAWFYRGRRRARGPVGRIAGGAALFTVVYLR
jgi:hypothetical protein